METETKAMAEAVAVRDVSAQDDALRARVLELRTVIDRLSERYIRALVTDVPTPLESGQAVGTTASVEPHSSVWHWFDHSTDRIEEATKRLQWLIENTDL